MKNEKVYLATSGYLMLLLVLVILGATIAGLIIYQNPWFIIGFVLTVFLCIGFVIVSPNESSVLVLFGEYKGTIKQNGFFWTNPFF